MTRGCRLTQVESALAASVIFVDAQHTPASAAGSFRAPFRVRSTTGRRHQRFQQVEQDRTPLACARTRNNPTVCHTSCFVRLRFAVLEWQHRASNAEIMLNVTVSSATLDKAHGIATEAPGEARWRIRQTDKPPGAPSAPPNAVDRRQTDHSLVARQVSLTF